MLGCGFDLANSLALAITLRASGRVSQSRADSFVMQRKLRFTGRKQVILRPNKVLEVYQLLGQILWTLVFCVSELIASRNNANHMAHIGAYLLDRDRSAVGNLSFLVLKTNVAQHVRLIRRVLIGIAVGL